MDAGSYRIVKSLYDARDERNLRDDIRVRLSPCWWLGWGDRLGFVGVWGDENDAYGYVYLHIRRHKQALRQHAPEARVAVHVKATTEEVSHWLVPIESIGLRG